MDAPAMTKLLLDSDIDRQHRGSVRLFLYVLHACSLLYSVSRSNKVRFTGDIKTKDVF